ncbi:MAG TPA: hypothetical protein VFL83_01275 [Anaeromyxobacter sp.]|nr:hypothetical protein [Anaeromyxobacter sp.]
MRLRPALLLTALLSACQGSDPQPLVWIDGDTFYPGNIAFVAGGGASEFIAYTRFSNSATAPNTIRLLRHRAARPDALELVGDVDLGLGWAAAVSRLFVTGGAAVPCLGSTCWVIDLTSEALPRSTITLPGEPDGLAIHGRWLVSGAGTTVSLLDLQGGPGATFTARAPVTSVLPVPPPPLPEPPAGPTFLAFTTVGYVRVTADAAPTFAEVDDPTLRSFAAAFPDGAGGLVAGPSPTYGFSRVVRLDLSSPATPVVSHVEELPVHFASFAWDGGATSVVAASPGETFAPLRDGYVLRELEGEFTSAGIPLPQWWGDGVTVAMHADRLFTMSNSGFDMFRIAR